VAGTGHHHCGVAAAEPNRAAAVRVRIRSRVFRWYGQLRQIEDRSGDSEESAPGLVDELNKLEARVGKINVPLSYADELYALRDHIDQVRKRLLRA